MKGKESRPYLASSSETSNDSPSLLGPLHPIWTLGQDARSPHLLLILFEMQEWMGESLGMA